MSDNLTRSTYNSEGPIHIRVFEFDSPALHRVQRRDETGTGDCEVDQTHVRKSLNFPRQQTFADEIGEKDSPLERREQELTESISLLQVQISSAEDHLCQLKSVNDSLKTVTRGRICSNCHHVGHNRSNCRGEKCGSYVNWGLKDKHSELVQSISEAQKLVTSEEKLGNCKAKLGAVYSSTSAISW